MDSKQEAEEDNGKRDGIDVKYRDTYMKWAGHT